MLTITAVKRTYGFRSKLTFVLNCFPLRYTAPTVRRYVASQLDMFSLRSNSIYAHFIRIRYVAYGNESRLRHFLIAPQGISSALALYRVADISSDASAAHIDVESSCETHDRLDMPCTRKHIDRLNVAYFVSAL